MKILILIIAFVSFQVTAQNLKNINQKWLDENVFSVKTHLSDFSDLQFLKTELKDKRIVALGEQSHEDGVTFEARARLVKFLMEEMDFEVVLFEAGRFDLKLANDSLQKNKDIEFLKRGLYSFWNTKESEELYTYLQERLTVNKPTAIAGFDCKHTSQYGFQNYSKALRSSVQKTDEKLLETDQFKAYFQIWEDIEYEANNSSLGRIRFKMKAEEKEHFQKLSQWLTGELSGAGNEAWASQIRTLDESILAYSDIRLIKLLLNKKSLIPINNRRDELMAENLKFLLGNKFKNKKVILIGASYHFIRNNQKIEPIKVKGFPLHKSTVMGDLIYPEFKDEVYTIAFTAFEGTYGYVTQGKSGKEVKIPPSNSISFQLAKAGYQQAILPLKNTAQEDFWKSAVVLRLSDYQSDVSSKAWSEITDAVFFIKTMKPITYLP